MKHYVAYHNPDGMGYDATDIEPGDDACVTTNKPVASAIDGRVWLITGRGRPRRFALTGTFIVDRVKQTRSETLVLGSNRTILAPEVSLNELPWFPAFKNTMGNFGLGFQRITDPVFIRGLEKAASKGRRGR